MSKSGDLEGADLLRKVVESPKAQELTPVALENLKNWLESGRFLEFHDDDLRLLIEEEQFSGLNDRFHTIIPFGTGGRRGPMGVGTNRINPQTIGESAQGLSDYLLSLKIKKRDEHYRAVIAYDVRHHSKEFALIVAEVLTANSIFVHLFPDFRSTPELSFAVRELHADVGIVISASHNPPRDNGIKVYWSDGGQIVPPHEEKIIDAVSDVREIKRVSISEAKERGLLSQLGDDIDQQYLSAVLDEALTHEGDVGIVYTPLNGVGITSTVPVLRRLGYDKDLYIVSEQADPDGDFSGVANSRPNPEEPSSLEFAIEEAKSRKADIVLANDPDADRMASAAPILPHKDEWKILDGNQIGALLTYFILSQQKASGELRKDGLIVKTLVTTELISHISRSFGIQVEGNLLVGFKHIAQVIRELDDPGRFIFGTEESIGFLKGTYARDKDGTVAAMLMVELTAQLKKEGRTPHQLLDEIYTKYGYYENAVKNIFLEGAEGNYLILEVMKRLRSDPPKKIARLKVRQIRDYLTGKAFDPDSGRTLRTIEKPAGNLLIFNLSQDGRTSLAARPSGTEPKIKYYISVYSPSAVGAKEGDLYKIKQEAQVLSSRIIEEITEITMDVVCRRSSDCSSGRSACLP